LAVRSGGLHGEEEEGEVVGDDEEEEVGGGGEGKVGEGEIVVGRLGLAWGCCSLFENWDGSRREYLRFGFFCRCETKQQCGAPLELEGSP